MMTSAAPSASMLGLVWPELPAGRPLTDAAMVPHRVVALGEPVASQ